MEKTEQATEQATKDTYLTRFLQRPKSLSPAGDQGYLLGLRGLFTISSFLWLFLTTFAPACVKDAANRDGPLYQIVLRDTFSVLFWNQSLIYSFFILSSARTLPIAFFTNPSKTTIASSVLRRGLRLWFPVAVSLAIIKITTSAADTTASISAFKTRTGNTSFETPYVIPNTLAYFNSVFNLFWITAKPSTQAASTAFPSQTLWSLNIIYMQSYTIYMTQLIIPYTRPQWRLRAYFLFILTAWWVQSWAWYTITGLLLADITTTPDFHFAELAADGVRVWRGRKKVGSRGKAWYCPLWVPAGILLFAGLVMQYLWTAWRPEYENKELLAHTGLYYTGGLNTLPVDAGEPQARDDNYLVLVGLFLMVESTGWVKRGLGAPGLLFLGRRSLSYFLTQSIIIYTAGIKLHTALTLGQHHVSAAGATVVTLLVCVPTVAFFGEVFYRLVDWPSQVFAGVVFDWIRE